MICLLCTGQRLDGAAVELIVLPQAKCGNGFPDPFFPRFNNSTRAIPEDGVTAYGATQAHCPQA